MELASRIHLFVIGHMNDSDKRRAREMERAQEGFALVASVCDEVIKEIHCVSHRLKVDNLCNGHHRTIEKPWDDQYNSRVCPIFLPPLAKCKPSRETSPGCLVVPMKHVVLEDANGCCISNEPLSRNHTLWVRLCKLSWWTSWRQHGSRSCKLSGMLTALFHL